MNDRELLQQALDALEKHVHEYETIQAIKTRLAPPKKEWVGLTDEEIVEVLFELKTETMGVIRTERLARAVEAKLKEKNS